MEFRKMVTMILYTGQQWRNRHREQTNGHGERGGEGEMYAESNMETYITIIKIDSQQEFAVWLRKLKQGLCINLEDGIGEGNGNPLQYSRLEGPMDGGAWWATVHGVAKSWTWLSDFTFTFMLWRRKWQPTQCSCLENPRDGGAWWATIYGVAELDTTEAT